MSEYNALDWDPEILKLIMGMQGNRPQSLTPNSLMGGGKQVAMAGGPKKPQAPQDKDSWLNYLGIGAGAISPIAAALLSRQRQGGSQLPGGSVGLGSKPMMGVPSPYPQNQRMPPFLARLLMGGR